MTIAYLNGDYAPLAAVRISPMDRGFLFGDGVYEVSPCYDGKMVALQYHLERLHQSLDGIALTQPYSDGQLIGILDDIVARNGAGDLGIYLQITRGVVEKRQHAFPEHPLPTVFAYACLRHQPTLRRFTRDSLVFSCRDPTRPALGTLSYQIDRLAGQRTAHDGSR